MRIGIDVGGTKIEAIALADDGAELTRRRVDTPQGDYEATLEAIVRLVREVERDTARTGSVGVGMPGAFSGVTGRVKNANSTCLNDQPFDQDLMARLGREARFANDANCFALSEATDGAGAGASVVFGVILGTGVGGGIVANGRILVGRNAIGGEWGHNPLPWPRDEERPGPPCYCGQHGCIEAFLSGPGLVADWRRAPRASDGANPETDATSVLAAAERGEPTALAALERYEDRLARALAQVINILDPDVIVLGGGLSKVERLYGAVARQLPRHVFSDAVDTPLYRPKHGDSSGVRGAAWLWDVPDRGPTTPADI
jgi:fructokinase